MKRVIITALLLLASNYLIAQETLDLKLFEQCELFSVKDNFNKQERLEEIKKLGGKLVTVYLIKGKNNKVRSKYTGTVDLTLMAKPNMDTELVTNVLIISIDNGNGQMTAKFPHMDKKEYRIYLTDCLSRK
ncbi:MAG: hypothetical protein JKX84_03445 [Flavobacteriales bacterium]|nr:hypothetical protein [Flavobacteriales bacterium]